MLGKLEQTLTVLSAYTEPDLYISEIQDTLVKGKHFNLKTVKRYYELLISIQWFVKKVTKYKIYFKEFYPNSKEIQDFEALEHHIHAYLEDLATVKNKLAEYIGALKNDLGQVAVNKKEIKHALTFLDTQIHKVLEDPLKLRRPHRHNGFKFIDSNITSAEVAHVILDEKSPIKHMLTEAAIENFKKQRTDSFEKAKEFWLGNAVKNESQIIGVADEIIERTEGFLYKFLDIQPEEFIKKFPKSKELVEGNLM